MRVNTVTVVPTLTLNAYTAGDTVGGLLTFDVGWACMSGKIVSIAFVDDANQKEQYTIFLYDSLPSTIANDAAYEPTVADLKLLLSTVTLATADWTTISGNAYALLGGHEDGAMDIEFFTPDGNIYMYLMATDTPDYAAATDLTIIMRVEY